MDGTKVKGYWVQDETTGMAGYMSKDRVDDLGLKKLVSNCTAQQYQGVVTLKGIGFKVQKLPRYDVYGNRVDNVAGKQATRRAAQQNEPEYALLFKVMNSKLNTGFYVLDLRTGNKIFLTREEVIELAACGKIRDVKTNKSKDKFILRGTKTQIENLPVMTPSTMRQYMSR